MKMSALDRFMRKVEKRADGCWNWNGAINSGGYAFFFMRGRGMVAAHRAAWELFRGAIPRGRGYHGTCLLHSCDNRFCTNPDHLSLGTQADNVRDMVRKGRNVSNPRKGESHPRARLTEVIVAKIKRLLKRGELQSRIAARFGINESHVSKINLGRVWRTV